MSKKPITSNLKKLWALFDKNERQNAAYVLFTMVLASASSVFMIGSIMPFLYILSNPDILNTNSYVLSAKSFLKIQNNDTFVLVLGLCVLTAIIVSNMIGMAKVYVLSRYAQMRTVSLSKKMFEHQLSQPYEMYSQTPPGIFMRRCVTEPTQSINNFFVPFTEALASAITAFFIIAFLSWYNFTVTASVILFMVISYFAMSKIIGNSLRKHGQDRVESQTQRSQVLQEVFRCFRDIRLSNQEAEFSKRFRTYSMQSAHTQIMSQFWGSFPRHWIQMLFFGAIICVCIFIILVDTQKTQDLLLNALPTIGLFVLSGQRLLPEIQIIYNSRNKMIFGLASVEALMEGIEAHQNHQIQKGKTPKQNIEMNNELRLEKVSYLYGKTNQGLLPDFNLTLKKGTHVGIVGESGSGKSTLANILMGLVLPKSGKMVVDKTTLTEENISSWALNVAQVPQEVMLLSTDIRRNIAIGTAPEKIDDDKVWKALEKANLSEWVQSLENKLDTDIMSGASLISGGQKQRIGLARAFYRETDFFVFDEATSALDEKTETEIQNILKKELLNKTAVTIAHRLNTLKICDRIIELEKGRIVFDGTLHEFETRKSKNHD